MDDLYCSLGPHDGQLRGGPGQREVGAHRLGVHDHVGAPVSLAGDHLDAGHGRLTVGVEQLRPVPDDPPVFLVDAGQEPGHIDEGDQGNVKSVASANEPSPLL